MADTEAAEGPGVGHEQRSRIGGRWERRSHPLTGRRSTQRNRQTGPDGNRFLDVWRLPNCGMVPIQGRRPS